MAKKDEEREQRLAAALRENLKRRKAQARGSVDVERSESHENAPHVSHPGEGRDP